MKLMRYSASGTTHNSGTGARSVDTCVVTPSNKLDGSAASATQRATRHPCGFGLFPTACSCTCAGFRMTVSAHANTNPTYPITPPANTQGSIGSL